jgi:hypothetical protein
MRKSSDQYDERRRGLTTSPWKSAGPMLRVAELFLEDLLVAPAYSSSFAAPNVVLLPRRQHELLYIRRCRVGVRMRRGGSEQPRSWVTKQTDDMGDTFQRR